MYKCCSLLEKKKGFKRSRCSVGSIRLALVCILFLKKKKKKKEGENECKSHIDMNEDLNMISNIWRFVFLKKGLINGLFAQCKLF